MRQRKLTWLGHVTRNEEAVYMTIMNGMVYEGGGWRLRG